MDKKLFTLGVGAFVGGFAAILCLGAMNGCGRKGDLIAIVNDDPISLSEFTQYLENKPNVNVVTESGAITLPVNGSLGFQALRDVVNQDIELQIAKDRGVYPTEADVDNELIAKKGADPNYLIELIERGLTLAVIKKNIRLELAEERLLTQGVKFTTRDAVNYIKSHPSRFMEPARVDMSYIFVKDPAKRQKMDDELASGQSFSTVAVRFSEAQTARLYNGKFADPNSALPTVGSLPPAVQQALAKLNGEGTTGWIAFNGGFAKFEVEKEYPAHPTAIDDAKIESFRRELAKIKGAQTNDLSAMIGQKLRQSKVEIVAEQYQNAWKSARELQQ